MAGVITSYNPYKWSFLTRLITGFWAHLVGVSRRLLTSFPLHLREISRGEAIGNHGEK